MSSLRPRWLLLLAAVALLLGGVLVAATGLPGYLVVLLWGPLALSLLLALAELVLARRVRAFVREPREKPIEPLFAARVAVMAQTVAVYGVLLLGWSLGVLMNEVAVLRYRSVTEGFWLVTANAVAAVLLLAAGLVSESWCRRPPRDGEDEEDRPGNASERIEPARGEGGYARNHRDGDASRS